MDVKLFDLIAAISFCAYASWNFLVGVFASNRLKKVDYAAWLLSAFLLMAAYFEFAEKPGLCVKDGHSHQLCEARTDAMGVVTYGSCVQTSRIGHFYFRTETDPR